MQAKKNGKTIYPITSLAWKPTDSDNQYDQNLLCCCSDGSIVHWNSYLANNSERIILNDEGNCY